MEHACLSRNLDTIPNLQVPGHAGLSGKDDTIPQFCAPPNPDKCNDQSIFANGYIMADLYQIVDFRPLANPGFMETGTVNSRVCTDFYPIFQYHVPDLRDLGVEPGFGNKAKTVRTDDRTGLQDHLATHHTMILQYSIGKQAAAIAHNRMSADIYIGLHVDAIPYPRFFPHDTTWPNVASFPYRCRWVDNCAGVAPWFRFRGIIFFQQVRK